jgi:beta-glucosidase
MNHRFYFLILILVIIQPVKAQNKKLLLYKNPSAPVEKRVADLLARMSLHDKIMQLRMLHDAVGVSDMKGKSFGGTMNAELDASTASRVFASMQRYLIDSTKLGIPMLTCTEALHGVYQTGCTVYPQALALGCTFNPMLVEKMAYQMSLELRAMNIKQVLSPDLDLARELRWGRVEETYGEDPFLNAIMGMSYVKVMQQNQIVCTPKHFVAHGTPTGGLNLASVSGGERELRSLYLYPFERVIKEAKPWSIMNAYSSYDGIPAASSHYLLTDILRKELGFKGYLISDWSSVDMLKSFHKTAANNAEAAMQAIKAGVDLEAASNCFPELENLVNQKKIDIKVIDQAVSRILYVKFVSGLFDKPVHDVADMSQVIHTAESVRLAKELADESVILLKNKNNILPFSLKKLSSIAVIGPNADKFQGGDYTWSRNNPNAVTPLQGIKAIVDGKIKIHYARGCDTWSDHKEGFAEAITAVKNSDVAVIFVGTESGTFTDQKNVTSGEGYDLSDLKLPGVQEELLKEIKLLGKPMVVVLVSGKPLAIPWVKENADAVLVQWYGGEQQGNAIADVLFGMVNPSGKLNVSFPKSVGHLPCYYNYLPTDKGFYKNPGSSAQPGRDYVFSNPDALWTFGEGLSYTKYDYLDASISSKKVKANDIVTITITVKNSGIMDGKEVVQIYVRDMVSSVVTPVQQLKAFKKQLIRSGESSVFELQIPVSDLYLYNDQMKRVVESGEFELQIGPASNDIKFRKMITVE